MTRHNWFLYDEKTKLGWLPILRNGHRFYKNHFNSCGWRIAIINGAVDNYLIKAVPNIRILDVNEIAEVICHIKHPQQRFISSLACILQTHHPKVDTLLRDLDFSHTADISTGLFYLKAFNDDHLYPISYLYSELWDKIHPVPMDHKMGNTNELTVKYFRSKNIDMNIPIHGKNYESNKDINQLKSQIEKLLETHAGNEFYNRYVAKWFVEDLWLYEKAHEFYNVPR